MPATPRFTVTQTDFAVVVSIKVPHVRVGGAETHVDGTEFSFYCKPYLLRLTLPHEVVAEDGDGGCKAVYDPADDNGTITATLTKATPGLHFPDLDLTTTLMQPRWTPKDLLRDVGAPPVSSGGVEVLSSEHYDVRDGDRSDDESSAGAATKAAVTAPAAPNGAVGGCGRQKPAEEERPGAGAGVRPVERAADAATEAGGISADILIQPPKYGFNDKFSGFFVSLRDELREMIHLPDPDHTPPSARRGLRLEHEGAEFDADRYLADLFPEEEDPILKEALAFEPHWQRMLRTQQRWQQQQEHRQQQPPQTKEQEREGPPKRKEDKHLLGEKGDVGAAAAAAAALRQALSSESGERDMACSPKHTENEGQEEQEVEKEEAEEEGFTEVEQEQMRRLPNREYLIGPGTPEERRVLLGLADILFAYAYDHRTTGGDASVESAWTVAVLSPLLSWLEVATAEEDGGSGVPPIPAAAAAASAETRVALAGIRRSLIFPYLRVWELGVLVARDVRDILSAGKRCVLRCLLQTHAIMERGEVHYLLNKLFIEDYCVWIQKASEGSLAALAERYTVAAACVTKEGTGLDLEEIEAEAARLLSAAEGAEEDSEAVSEASSEEEGSFDDEESSDEESSEEERSGQESSSGEGRDADLDSIAGEGGAEEPREDAASAQNQTPPAARKVGVLFAPSAAAAAAATADGARADAADESHRSPGALGDSEPGSGRSGGGEGKERAGSVSNTTTTSTADDGNTRQSSGSRGAEKSADLLRLEAAMADQAGPAAVTVSDASSALVSRLAVLSMDKRRDPLASKGTAPGVRILGDRGGAERPPPPPESSSDTGSSGGRGGTPAGGSQRRPLIEEL